MLRLVIVLTLVAFAPAAEAGGIRLSVTGVHANQVQDGVQRSLAALDLRHDASVAVEIVALDQSALHFKVRIQRGDRSYERAGVARLSDLGRRVASAALLGLLARDPDRFPRVALVVDSRMKQPDAAVIQAWRSVLARRGYTVLTQEEVELARTAASKLKESMLDTMRGWLGAQLVVVEMVKRGDQVAIQTTIADGGQERGELVTVDEDETNDQVTMLLEFAMLSRRGRS